jgi:hypothetical protein
MSEARVMMSGRSNPAIFSRFSMFGINPPTQNASATKQPPRSQKRHSPHVWRIVKPGTSSRAQVSAASRR